MPNTQLRFRTQYDQDYKSELFDTPVGEDEGLVQQSAKDECDINLIMARYATTGDFTHVAQGMQQFGDFSEIHDFQAAQNNIIEAEHLFSEIPANIRDRFNNDPQKFIDFCTDEQNQEKNLDSLREWGLAPPAPVVSERSNSETPQVPPAKPEPPKPVTPKVTDQ